MPDPYGSVDYAWRHGLSTLIQRVHSESRRPSAHRTH
jgi:hypothetical protein